jgi:hypothetical protein
VAEDRGDVLGAHAVKVQVDLSGPLDRAVCGAAAVRRRLQPQTASPDGGTYTRRYHGQEPVNDLGHGRAASDMNSR